MRHDAGCGFCASGTQRAADGRRADALTPRRLRSIAPTSSCEIVFNRGRMKKTRSLDGLPVVVVCALAMLSGDARAATQDMNAVAERYVHLVLALGQHDPDYVDAFYGPAEWKTQAEKEKKSLDAIGAEAVELSATLAKIPEAERSGDEMRKLRGEYLQKQ